MSNWEEIRALAANLQRVQLGETAKKLSDQNCIELVSKCLSLGLLDLVFTVDGKEYITRDHLATEIRNECVANKGRVSLVDLSQALNVDYQRIEDFCTDIAKSDPNFTLSVGQLISRDYLWSICADVNDRLQDEGRLHLTAVTKQHDLPSSLLIAVVHDALGSTIHGHKDRDDPTVLYTDGYVTRQRAVLRGALTATTKPTSISRLITAHNVQSNLFFGIFDQLLAEGTIRGQMTGGRTIERAVFVPTVYSELVKAYAAETFSQNGFLDFNVLKKLTVTDTNLDAFLKDVLDAKELKGSMRLSSCVLSGWTNSRAVSSIELSVQDHMQQQKYCVVTDCLPSVDLQNDSLTTKAIIDHVLPGQSNWLAVDDSMIYDKQLHDVCGRVLEPLLNEKLDRERPNVLQLMKNRQIAELSGLANEKKSAEINQDFATKKSGGKKNKKGGGKQQKTQEKEEDEGSLDCLVFMNEQQMVESLRDQCQDELGECPQEIVQAIVDCLLPQMNRTYRDRLNDVVLKAGVDDAKQLKAAHGQFQTQFTLLYNQILAFDLGAQSFDESTCEQLIGVLQRTLCTELLNEALCYVSQSPVTKQMAAKVQKETLAALPSAQAKDAFKAAYAALTGTKSLSAWHDAMHVLSEPGVCSLNMRPLDKKAKAEQLLKYINELKEQLAESTDAACSLLLACLLVFAQQHSLCVHATGKYVPLLITQLQTTTGKSTSNKELMELLEQMQTLVVRGMKNQSSEALLAELAQSHQLLKARLTAH